MSDTLLSFSVDQTGLLRNNTSEHAWPNELLAAIS